MRRCGRRDWVFVGEFTDEFAVGEVAAQALYQGQALTAKDPALAESLERASASGWTRVLLVGDAPYYVRFGFSREVTRALDFPKPYNPERLLGRALVEGALRDRALEAV